MMSKIGLGGAASAAASSRSGHGGPVDLDGQPLRAQDTAALVAHAIEDVCIDPLLDLKRCGSLGARASQSIGAILPVDAKGEFVALKSPAAVLESDADAQLLLYLPWTKPVPLLMSLILRVSVKDATSAPKTIHVYLNRPNLDFADAETTTPQQIVTLPLAPPGGRPFTKLELKEGVWEHQVTFAPASKYRGVTFLTLFVVDNHGAANTKLHGITLVGRAK
jgi:hypothetical protein